MERMEKIDFSHVAGEDTERILVELRAFAEELRRPGAAAGAGAEPDLEAVAGTEAGAEEKPAPAAGAEREVCDESVFTLLLSGISTCRKAPGLEGPVPLNRLAFCESEEDRELTREHLRRLYGVTDAASLEEACARMFHTGEDYRQFQSFWKGRPVFDEEELDESGRMAFGSCKAYAELFREFVGDRGFDAWDLNEEIGLWRKACACGIVTEEELYDRWRSAAAGAGIIYGSWEEYAISCLCGSVYFMFYQSALEDKGLYGFFDINRQLLAGLLAEGCSWNRYQWLRPVEKKWAMPASEMKELLTDWAEAEGCLATDRILVDGCRVGYMYREEPDDKNPDSGWRFFAGDESDEYVNNSENVGIYHLNTLCNSDPDILPYLHAPYGTAYFRDEKGQFQEEELILPEDE